MSIQTEEALVLILRLGLYAMAGAVVLPRDMSPQDLDACQRLEPEIRQLLTLGAA